MFERLDCISIVTVERRLKDISNLMLMGSYGRIKYMIACMIIDLLKAKDVQINKNLFDKVLSNFALINYHFEEKEYDKVQEIIMDLCVDINTDNYI